MRPDKEDYASYLLRLRLLQSEEHYVWVASIQGIATGERRSFSSVHELAQFLQTKFESEMPAPVTVFREQDGRESPG